MKYSGQFCSKHKNKKYEVEIITGGQSELAVEITIGPNGFITTMDNSAEVMYVPVKYSASTAEFVSSDYAFDLYADSAKDNTVKLYEISNNGTKSIVWTGYAQPNAYDVPYDFVTETYALECLDGLSILKYYDYEAGGIISTDEDGVKEYNKRFINFRDIINTILSVSGCYSGWYFSRNTSLMNNDSLLTMTISEENFFDEDGVPMKCSEVLEHICRYCGVTCLSYKDKVYFVDYDAIKHGVNTYEYFTVGGTTSSIVTLTSTKTIANTDYSVTGSTLSLDNTYSKVTVKDSLYTVDELLPDIFDENDLTNITSNNNYYNSMYTCSGSYIYTDKNGWQEFWGGDDSYKYFYSAHKIFKNNHNWISHLFNNSGSSVSTPTKLNAADAKSYIGCLPAAFYTVADKDNKEDPKKGNISFENYLFFFQNRNTATNKCLFENDINRTPKFFLPNGTKFIFSGDLLFSVGTYNSVPQANGSKLSFPYFPITEDTGNSNQSSSGDGGTQTHDYLLGCVKNELFYRNNHFGSWSWTKHTYNASELNFLNFSLGLGSRYLTGISSSSSNWGSTETVLQIPVTLSADETTKSIVSNLTVDDGIDTEGYVISAPSVGAGGCIAAAPHFKFYGFGTFGYLGVSAAWLKDFSLKCEYPLQLSGDERITDTEYEYTIDDSFTNELSDIEFKICTWDNKTVNYSAVAYPYSTDYQFVDKIYNRALGKDLRAEEQLCYKIAHQYQTASKKLNLNLFESSNNVTITPWTLITEPVVDCIMIVDNMNFDYKNDSIELNLIEKK